MTARPARLRGFPGCTLLALVDDDAALDRALGALAAYVDRRALQVLSGGSGIRALDVSGRHDGLLRRLTRAVQDVAYDRDGLLAHEAHLRRGGHVLLVPACGWARCQLLVGAVVGAGAHGLVWRGRHTVVDVTPRRRAVHTPAVLVAPDGPLPTAAPVRRAA